MVQHLALGIRTAPGIFGDEIGLVWFHFGINLAVYVAIAVPVMKLGRSWLRERPHHPQPVPVTA
jgi:hypothetical protein